MNSRINKILPKLEEHGLDSLLVSSAANITYLTSYPSRDSYFLVSKKGSFYFTDSRYTEEAKKALGNWVSVEKVNGSVFNLIADTCRQAKLKRIGFEERYLPFAEYRKIQQRLKKSKFIPTHSLIEELREIKEAQEISKIKKATQITIASLEYIASRLKPGVTELQIVTELEYEIISRGADGSAFEIIVASGPNSSYPHHISGHRKINKNEPVMIDIGVQYKGYKSDLTRVFFLGKMNVLAKKAYDIVLEAQQKALDKIKPGLKIRDSDRAARNYIAGKGLGDYFGHSLGHGIGLEVHENPHLNSSSEGVFEPGMVFTVEPAVYLPGKFGIRIEDDILITKKGCEVLSGSLDK